MNISLIIGIAIVVIIAAGIGAYYAMTSQTPAITPTSRTTTELPTTPATTMTTTTTEATTSQTISTSSLSKTTATHSTTTTTYSTTSSPSPTAISTTATSPKTTITSTYTTTTTTTTTSTSSTTTTVSPTTTATTITSTTTTTSPGQYINTTGITVTELLKTFRYIKMSFSYYNATSDETMTDYISLSQKSVILNGQSAIEIDLILNSTESGNLTMSIWTSPDYQHILQISYAGQTFSGPQAEIMGKQILQGLDKALYVTSSADFTFRVAEGEAQLVANGWTVNDFHQTTVTISNHNYEGYYYKVSNVNDANSDVSWAEGKIAKITTTGYYHVYLHLQLKDKDLFTLEITELEPL